MKGLPLWCEVSSDGLGMSCEVSSVYDARRVAMGGLPLWCEASSDYDATRVAMVGLPLWCEASSYGLRLSCEVSSYGGTSPSVSIAYIQQIGDALKVNQFALFHPNRVIYTKGRLAVGRGNRVVSSKLGSLY